MTEKQVITDSDGRTAEEREAELLYECVRAMLSGHCPKCGHMTDPGWFEGDRWSRPTDHGPGTGWPGRSEQFGLKCPREHCGFHIPARDVTIICDKIWGSTRRLYETYERWVSRNPVGDEGPAKSKGSP